MGFLRRIFGGSAAKPPQDGAIHLYVKCNKCGAPVHVRVDPRNDLSLEYTDSDEPAGYRLIKEIMDARCFKLMRAEITYDAAKRELDRTIDGGAYITRDEYERLAQPDA